MSATGRTSAHTGSAKIGSRDLTLDQQRLGRRNMCHIPGSPTPRPMWQRRRQGRGHRNRSTGPAGAKPCRCRKCRGWFAAAAPRCPDSGFSRWVRTRPSCGPVDLTDRFRRKGGTSKLSNRCIQSRPHPASTTSRSWRGGIGSASAQAAQDLRDLVRQHVAGIHGHQLSNLRGGPAHPRPFGGDAPGVARGQPQDSDPGPHALACPLRSSDPQKATRYPFCPR